MPERRSARPAHGPRAGPDAGGDDAPSKTQLKKESQALQALGEELLALPEARLAALALPEGLRTALAELRRIRSHEGRRRQLQYVGKLMRGVDPQPLRAALDAFHLPAARESLVLHEAERWRDRLLAGDAALAEFIDAHPGCEPQRLRALIRQARADGAATAPARDGLATRKSRAYRELFQLVRECAAFRAPACAPGSPADDERSDS